MTSEAVEMFIGLDIAQTMGVAVVTSDSPTILLAEVKGEPPEQEAVLAYLVSRYKSSYRQHFILEMPSHFRNAKTTRSLIERYGYLKYTLVTYDMDVNEFSPPVIRSALGLPNRKRDVLQYFREMFPAYAQFLTDNHTDALATAIAGAMYMGEELDLAHPQLKFYRPGEVDRWLKHLDR